MNMNECMIDFNALKEFKEPLLFFELINFRNSFCFRIENS